MTEAPPAEPSPRALGESLAALAVQVAALRGQVNAINERLDQAGLCADVNLAARFEDLAQTVADALEAVIANALGFLLHFGNFRGRLRDVRVGIYHGGYCVGCCWSLMLVLVAVGVMNVAWMVVLTAVVFAEKIWRSGQAFGYAVGATMIIAALLLPWLSPVQTALLG